MSTCTHTLAYLPRTLFVVLISIFSNLPITSPTFYEITLPQYSFDKPSNLTQTAVVDALANLGLNSSCHSLVVRYWPFTNQGPPNMTIVKSSSNQNFSMQKSCPKSMRLISPAVFQSCLTLQFWMPYPSCFPKGLMMMALVQWALIRFLFASERRTHGVEQFLSSSELESASW